MIDNMPKVKVGIVAVSRDCFPESLSVNRRKALVEAYTKKYDAADIYEMQRLMGAGACLFAIFLVPEIWKNRRNQAMEIEGATYYSLRQVCMARILLFGFMDLLIVTAFAVSVVFTVRISVQMFAVNFLIPFNVTGAICF